MFKIVHKAGHKFEISNNNYLNQDWIISNPNTQIRTRFQIKSFLAKCIKQEWRKLKGPVFLSEMHKSYFFWADDKAIALLNSIQIALPLN